MRFRLRLFTFFINADPVELGIAAIRIREDLDLVTEEVGRLE